MNELNEFNEAEIEVINFNDDVIATSPVEYPIEITEYEDPV